MKLSMLFHKSRTSDMCYISSCTFWWDRVCSGWYGRSWRRVLLNVLISLEICWECLKSEKKSWNLPIISSYEILKYFSKNILHLFFKNLNVQTLLQNCSNQGSVVLASRQACRSMGWNWKSRNKACTFLINFRGAKGSL